MFPLVSKAYDAQSCNLIVFTLGLATLLLVAVEAVGGVTRDSGALAGWSISVLRGGSLWAKCSSHFVWCCVCGDCES